MEVMGASGELICTDLDRLVDKEFLRVSMGLKPSGDIHLGTAMTFLHGMLVLQANSSAKLNVSIKDLDFDFQRGLDFVSFMHKRDPGNCHVLLKDHVAKETVETLEEMGRYFGIEPHRYGVTQFSSITYDRFFQEYIVDLFSRDRMRTLLVQSLVGGKVKANSFLAPNCECGHASNSPPKVIRRDCNILVETRCYNRACPTEGYTVNLTDPGKVNFFYLFDKVRDLIPNEDGELPDLHIFGGDYGLPYGVGRTVKAQRVLNLLLNLSTTVPSIYVGPSINFDSVKISKSKGSPFSLKAIREMHTDWVDRMHSLLIENPQQRDLDLYKMPKYFS